MNEAILDRIEKDRHNKMEVKEIEFYAEAETLKEQYIDNNDIEKLHSRLSKGKMDILALERKKRVLPFDTEIFDLNREAKYLNRIRSYLDELFINLESVDRIIKHTDKEIEDIKDRISILSYERGQIR